MQIPDDTQLTHDAQLISGFLLQEILTPTHIIQGVFLTGPPQFQYQKKLPSSQSGPFFVTEFTETAAGIG